MVERATIASSAIYARHPFVREILLRLQKAGYEAVLVGGVVRDGLLHQDDPRVPFPPEDIDIATAALPQEIRELFSDCTVLGVGEEFGVLLLVAPDGQRYEVATFRVESEYDGRWPGRVHLVRQLAEDVRRRDLTVNGLACALDGEVIDLVGGIEDLRARRIRAIGDPEQRFREDVLRTMRVVRFACHINGTVDEATAQAVRACSGEIRRVSAERVGEELLGILGTPRAARGVGLLEELGLLLHILPELSACAGVPQPEEYHPEGDVFVHTTAALAVADGFVRTPIVKLAVALHDIGKPTALERNEWRNMGGHCAIGASMALQIARRLRLSKARSQHLQFLVKQHMRIADFPKMNRGKQIRFLSECEQPSLVPSERYERFYDVLRVMISDCEASAHRSSGWAPVLQETVRVMDHVERVCGLQRAREMVDGHDLLRLGLPPGPKVGEILTHLHDRILSGQITNRSQALETAHGMISEPDPED